MMRTTLSLDSELLRRAKELSAQTGQTLTAVIEQALRAMLYGSPRQSKDEKLKLHTFKGKGLMPGVDLDDTASLYDLLNEKQ